MHLSTFLLFLVVGRDHMNLLTEGRDRPSMGMSLPQMATELCRVFDCDLSLFRATIAPSILRLSFLTIKHDERFMEIALHLLGDIWNHNFHGDDTWPVATQKIPYFARYPAYSSTGGKGERNTLHVLTHDSPRNEITGNTCHVDKILSRLENILAVCKRL